MGQHVPPQVLLVLGSKAALVALVRPQARVLRHVGLREERGGGHPLGQDRAPTEPTRNLPSEVDLGGDG